MRLLLQNFKITEFTSITVMLTIYIWNPITQDKGYEMKHSWQQLVPSLNYYLVFKNCSITYLLCLCAHNGLKYVFHLHFCKDGVCKLPFGAILLSCEQILSSAKSNLFVYNKQVGLFFYCRKLPSDLLYKTEILVLTLWLTTNTTEKGKMASAPNSTQPEELIKGPNYHSVHLFPFFFKYSVSLSKPYYVRFIADDKKAIF